MAYYKALIRVVKSLSNSTFGSETVIREPVIVCESKEEAKHFMAEKYPQFFPNSKVYSKETKDNAQFFYLLIYDLYAHERRIVEENISWTCDHCGQVHENEYVSKPRRNERLFGPKRFCRSTDDNNSYDLCMEAYQRSMYEGVELPDDTNYIKIGSPNYIYKVTEKSSGKCYIGKTRNAPFFRWWNHLTHSSSPFGLYLRSTKLSEWSFEVLVELPSNTPYSEIFKIESDYIRQFNSISNGYNSVISQKKQQEFNDVFNSVDNG